MMLSPEDYMKEFESASLKKVLQERDRIIDFMHDFEANKIPKKYFEHGPNPEFVYFTHLDYLKELCELIKIKMHEKNNKTVRLSPFLAIEDVISKFDDEKQKEFFNDLKAKDPELYYKYLEWKMDM